MQCLFDLGIDIDKLFFASLAVDADPLVVPVDILEVDAHQFTDANAGIEKQSQDRHVAHLLFFGESNFCLGQRVAGFSPLKNIADLILFEVCDGLFLDLGHIHQFGHIFVQIIVGDQVTVKCAQRGKLARAGRRFVGRAQNLAVIGIDPFVVHEISHVVLDVIRCELSQHIGRDLHGSEAVGFLHELIEHFEIADITEYRARRFIARHQIFIGKTLRIDRHLIREIKYFVNNLFVVRIMISSHKIPVYGLQPYLPHKLRR